MFTVVYFYCSECYCLWCLVVWCLVQTLLEGYSLRDTYKHCDLLQLLPKVPHTRRKTSSSHLHTCVHLSSRRIRGSRSSEPILPPPNTADCKGCFLQETKYKQDNYLHFWIPYSCTSRAVIHSWCLKFLTLVLFLYCPGDSSGCSPTPRGSYGPCLHTFALINNPLLVGTSHESSHSTQYNQFALLTSSTVVSQQDMGKELFYHNFSLTHSPRQLCCDKVSEDRSIH